MALVMMMMHDGDGADDDHQRKMPWRGPLRRRRNTMTLGERRLRSKNDPYSVKPTLWPALFAVEMHMRHASWSSSCFRNSSPFSGRDQMGPRFQNRAFKAYLTVRTPVGHLQIWVCVFCCSGARPRKGGERFAKGLHTTIYEHICTRKHDHNSLSRFCWGAKGARKGGVKAVFGYHNFWTTPKMICMKWNVLKYNINPIWISLGTLDSSSISYKGNFTNTYVVYKKDGSSMITCPNINNKFAFLKYFKIP